MAYNQELAERIRAYLNDTPEIVEKKMFGGVGYLLQGNMACGVNRDDLIVRFPADQYEAALQEMGVRPFDMTGRPMKGWVTVSSEGYKTEGDLKRWIERGVEYARSLPPK